MEEIDGDEPDASEQETEAVDEFAVLEERNDDGPEDGTDGLYGKEDAYPVGCFLVLGGFHVEDYACGAIYDAFDSGCVEGTVGDGAVGVGPHEHEGCPAEELHESDGPEGRWCFQQQLEHVGRVLGICLFFFADGVVLVVEFRWIFLHLCGGVEDAKDEDGCSDVEGIDDGIGDDSFGCRVADADGCEDEWEEITDEAACIAEEGLDAVGESFLLLVDHVADHHLEWLHGHVDGGVEEHEGDESEDHCRSYGHAEGTSVGQKAHDEDGDKGSDEEVRNAAAEACPRAVGEGADDGLHDDAHEWWENPEVAEAVGVGSEGGEDAADVGALECVCYLHAKESETDVPEFPE